MTASGRSKQRPYICIRMSTHPIALITGATAGIGEATAEVLAAQGHDLIITGRRVERLNALADRLGQEHGVRVHPLAFDIMDAAAVEAALHSLPDDWRAIRVLVNNAGLARGLGPVDQGSLSDWTEMIDTNLKGLLYVTRIVAGWMRAAGIGHIINVGSIAGKEAYANGNVYVATKHAVEALTRAMRMDWVGTGIKVSAVHPGMVETEFSMVRFRGDSDRAGNVYKGLRPLSGRDVAEVIGWMVAAPAHVNLADVVVLPSDQASATIVHRR